MTFHVGQKVEQVQDWHSYAAIMRHNPYADVEFTRCGVVYTIREIISIDGIPGLRFNELVNPVKKYARRGALEQPFPAANFRPVVSRKTSIKIFTKMLTPQGVDA